MSKAKNGKYPVVVITGAAGYIGSNAVVKMVMETNAQVIAVDRRKMKWKSPTNVKKKVVKYQLDICEPELSKVFRIHDVDAIIHFAGDISVPESVSDPMKYYNNNVLGTMNLLDQCRQHKVCNFIFSSSAAVYGEPTKSIAKEDDVLLPINPYGESKLMVEQILRACSHAHPSFKHCSLRYFNVVGNDLLQRAYDPYWKEKSNLFPALMRAYLGYTPDIRLFGTKYKTSDGTCVRDYIHVGDLIDAHILALSKIMTKQPMRNVYNVGNGKGYTVKEVIESFERVVGPIPVVEAPRRAGDPEKLIACPKRIKRDLKFKPNFKHIDDMVRTYAKMICVEPVPGMGGMWKEKK